MNFPKNKCYHFSAFLRHPTYFYLPRKLTSSGCSLPQLWLRDSQLPLPIETHHFKLARQKVSRFTNCFPSFRRAFILVGMENLISSDFMPLWKRKKSSLPFYAPLFQKAYTNTQAHTHIQLYVWKTHNTSLAEGVTKSGFSVRNTLYELKPFFHHISPPHIKTHAHTQAGND